MPSKPARRRRTRAERSAEIIRKAPREVMTEAEAARACASMFVRKGIPEGKEPGEFEITDVSFDDDGQHFVTMIVRVGDLDVEMASGGHHMDQAELNAIHAEPRDE
jgi:hypothetical protein